MKKARRKDDDDDDDECDGNPTKGVSLINGEANQNHGDIRSDRFPYRISHILYVDILNY